MFTGIVTHIGVVSSVHQQDEAARIGVTSSLDYDTVDVGGSIAHAGTCLTVVAKARLDDGNSTIYTQAVSETLEKSNLSGLYVGKPINLEMSMKYGDEVGGHLVSGHVDGLAETISIRPFGGGHTVRFRPPPSLQKFIAEKGSIALDGVSLTVAKLHENNDFDICVIPHTWAVTTFESLKEGDKVNLEIDPIARYVARILSHIPNAPSVA